MANIRPTSPINCTPRWRRGRFWPRVVGLDVAGIDIVACDISRPMEEQGAMVVEVNAGPGLQMHSEPQVGVARPVGAAIMETLFPDGQTGRIPLVAVTRGAGSTIAARVAAHLMRQAGPTVGLACSTGTFVGPRRLAAHYLGPGPGPAELLINPTVEAGVFEISAESVYSEGLVFDCCRVAVVLPEEGGDSGVHEPDAWRRIIVQTVSPLGTAVLSADDPAARRLASSCRGAVLYCQAAESHPQLKGHRSAGGKVVFLRGSSIWAAYGEHEFEIGPVAMLEGRLDTAHALAVLAGAAAALSASVPTDLIRQGLATLGPWLDASAATTTGGAEARSDQTNAA